jgi:plasmid maintenance system antidote protein VapI
MYMGKEEGRRTVNDLLTKYICLNVGTTYKQVAEALGVHERTLYKWLSGEARVPAGAARLLELMVIQKSV